MSEVLLRQWVMLRVVPTAAPGIDTATLRDKLADQGLTTTQRTIQRDLVALSNVFPLICEDTARPYRWRWMERAPVWDIPGMEPATALTFKLVEQYIPSLLPPPVLNHLAGHFERADVVLAETGKASSFKSWRDRIRVLNKGMPLRGPETPKEITDVVYTALLRTRQVRVHYRPREQVQSEPREYVINPLGIVVRDNVIYLVCTFWSYADVRQLALHRISSAELLDIDAQQPAGFDLDKYVESGAFDIVQGAPLRLVALFDSAAAFHLRETPLSDDQSITESAPGRVKVRATVPDTSQLRWWLLAFGEQVNVLKPARLRRDMSATARCMAENYGVL